MFLSVIFLNLMVHLNLALIFSLLHKSLPYSRPNGLCKCTFFKTLTFLYVVVLINTTNYRTVYNILRVRFQNIFINWTPGDFKCNLVAFPEWNLSDFTEEMKSLMFTIKMAFAD